MKNRFFSFLDPVLEFIDNGKFFRRPFEWLYKAVGVLNLLTPLVALFSIMTSGMLRFLPARAVFGIVLMWLVLTGLAWFSFQIWWNRSAKVNGSSAENDEFVAIPAYSHLVQTTGEWIGMYVGVGGFLFTIIAVVIGGEEFQYTFSSLTMGGMVGVSFFSSFLYLIVGFIIVVVARVLAEIIRALAAIANNTRNLRNN